MRSSPQTCLHGGVQVFFAGIGSRKTPIPVLESMTDIGNLIRRKGGYVRSGHSDGADLAFERGAEDRTIVYLPWRGFNRSSARYAPDQNYLSLEDVTDKTHLTRAKNSVQVFHPNAEGLRDNVRKLMMRNWFQVMGVSGDTPVSAVICWAKPVDGPYGEVEGGTGQAVRIARAKGIPVFNLYEIDVAQVKNWVWCVLQNARDRGRTTQEVDHE